MDYKKALNRSAALCSKQEYCCADLQKKHETWGVSHEDSDKILDFLTKEKFIDESRYARFFVRDKFRFNRWGKQKIGWQLKQKRIPREIINDALTNIPREEYLQTLEGLVNEKMKQSKHSDSIKLKAALIRNAASKGFEYEVIIPVVERLLQSES